MEKCSENISKNCKKKKKKKDRNWALCVCLFVVMLPEMCNDQGLQFLLSSWCTIVIEQIQHSVCLYTWQNDKILTGINQQDHVTLLCTSTYKEVAQSFFEPQWENQYMNNTFCSVILNNTVYYHSTLVLKISFKLYPSAQTPKGANTFIMHQFTSVTHSDILDFVVAT